MKTKLATVCNNNCRNLRIDSRLRGSSSQGKGKMLGKSERRQPKEKNGGRRRKEIGRKEETGKAVKMGRQRGK